MQFPALLLLIATVHAATFTVTVGPNESLTFSPARTTVNVGDTVNFVFAPSSHQHSVVQGTSCTAAPAAAFNIRATGSYTFTKAGEFPYFCDIGNHCQQGMVGTVVVNAASSPSSPSPSTTSTPTKSSATSVKASLVGVVGIVALLL
jgi:plastocyanin